MWPWRVLAVHSKPGGPRPAHTSSSDLQTYPGAPLTIKKAPSGRWTTPSLSS